MSNVYDYKKQKNLCEKLEYKTTNEIVFCYPVWKDQIRIYYHFYNFCHCRIYTIDPQYNFTRLSAAANVTIK